MERVGKSIDIRVPVHLAYDPWTHFEEFPRAAGAGPDAGVSGIDPDTPGPR